MLNDESNQRTLINYMICDMRYATINYIKKTQRFEQVLFEIFQGNPFYRSGRKLENRGNHANHGNSS